LDRRWRRGGRRSIVIAIAAAATAALAVATLRLLRWWTRRCRLRSGSVAAAVTLALAAPFALLWLSLGSRWWRGWLRSGRRRLFAWGWSAFTTRRTSGVGRLRNLQERLVDFGSHRQRRGGT
jgi:hypothetical protein